MVLLLMIKQFYNAKVLAAGLTLTPKALAVHFGLKSPVCTEVDTYRSSTTSHSTADMSTWWVPPSGYPEDCDDYHTSVLGKDKLL